MNNCFLTTFDQVVFEHIGDLLVILITLDEIIHQQQTLKEHWILYKR